MSTFILRVQCNVGNKKRRVALQNQCLAGHLPVLTLVSVKLECSLVSLPPNPRQILGE